MLRYPRCVASSSSLERIHLSLEVTGLASSFCSNIFSATQVTHGKPAPDLYLFAATRMSVAPEDCVVIEDSALGVTAGRAAGMKVIGFTGGAHSMGDAARHLASAGAYPIVSSMAELPATVEGVMSCVEPRARLDRNWVGCRRALNRPGADRVKNLQCGDLFGDIVNAEQRGASSVCGEGSGDRANKLGLNLLLA